MMGTSTLYMTHSITRDLANSSYRSGSSNVSGANIEYPFINSGLPIKLWYPGNTAPIA